MPQDVGPGVAHNSNESEQALLDEVKHSHHTHADDSSESNSNDKLPEAKSEQQPATEQAKILEGSDRVEHVANDAD